MLMARRIPGGHQQLLKNCVSRCCTRRTIFFGGGYWKVNLAQGPFRQ